MTIRQKQSIALATVAVLMFGGGLAMATDPDWKKMKEEAEAEKAALDAQRELLEARQKLAEAQTPTEPDTAARKQKIEDAKATKELAEAEKAVSDAAKAAAEADLAALKSKFGTVPDSGYSGSVTAGAGTGNAEAMLLAARAVKIAASQIAKTVAPEVMGKTVLVYAAPSVPTFDALLAYRAQTGFLKKAFEDAAAMSSSADTSAPAPAGVKTGEAPLLAAAGLGLEAVNKLFGFFRSDYSIGGVTLTVDDSLLVAAVSEELRAAATVQIPHVYQPGVLSDPVGEVLANLKELALIKSAAPAKAEHHLQLSKVFSGLAEKETDATKKADLTAGYKKHSEAEGALKGAGALFDAFFGKLTSADEKANVPIARVLREAALADVLTGGGYLLVVKLQSAAGSYYSVKNMWTFFGGMPIRHMGSVVASFTLFDGATGAVKASGAVPVHGGFVKPKKVQEVANGSDEEAVR